ncbi:cytochrome c biogenesis protein ResB [Termitidicoccus mucosus]|uniref:ResB-like domain-containing protein n=1 Tax=Termitidicoccus mucosus TaxID=1184151 RepID=A0A178IKR4_9BACT|nr:hypothetical protein AW736_00615 [Opitutaceae bacterium TSB47]
MPSAIPHANTLPARLACTQALSAATGVYAAGVAIQLVTRRAIPEPAWPVNFILLAAFAAALVITALAGRRSPFVRWLRSVPVSISAIALVLVQAVLMGTLRQSPGAGILGDVMHSWPFVLTMFYFLTNLGLATVARAVPFKRENLGFLLNHLGLWIALSAGMLGAGDLARLAMELRAGAPEWRAIDRSHAGHAHLVEMPFALELRRFEMDTYAPKLVLLDTKNNTIAASRGRAPVEISAPANSRAPDGAPLQSSTLGDWSVDILEYIPEALGFADNYHAMPGEPGAAPAVRVAARRHSAKERARHGWVSCGSFATMPAMLELDDGLALAMPDPEPRRFASQVEVFAPGRESRAATIEVNRPLALGGWKIYQLSYDQRRGRWSQTSIVELVRDPWLPGVYTGVFMMMAGVFFLMARARRKAAA